jgi:hypothetical protein
VGSTKVGPTQVGKKNTEIEKKLCSKQFNFRVRLKKHGRKYYSLVYYKKILLNDRHIQLTNSNKRGDKFDRKNQFNFREKHRIEKKNAAFQTGPTRVGKNTRAQVCCWAQKLLRAK